MNGQQYFIVSDQMSAGILHHLEEILNRLKIGYEKKSFQEYIPGDHAICFTSSIIIAQKLSKDFLESNVFLITDQTHESIGEAVYEIGSNQMDCLAGIIDLIEKNAVQANKNRVLGTIFSHYQKMLIRTNTNLLKTNEAIKHSSQNGSDDMLIVIELLNIYNVFLEFENKLFGIFETTDYFNLLNIEIKKNGLFEKLEFICLPKLHEIYSDLDFAYKVIYPLDSPTNGFVLIERLPNQVDCLQEIREIFFIRMINDFLKRQLSQEKIGKNNDILERTLSLIPYPLALFGQNKALILYNQKFLQMNILPSVCIRLSHEEKYEHDGQFYKIYRKEFDFENENYVYYSFVSDKDVLDRTDKNLSSSELGIISSSIAHELNNPLAGILAAIEVLLLDDAQDAEVRQSLIIMQDSAKRSKELVEIFLGFSKKDPRYYKSTSIKTSFILAINLLRFRMIESSVRLEMNEFLEIKSFKKELNGSVLAMIFYIILGEIITVVSKMELITARSQNSSEEIIQGGLIISEDELIIHLETVLTDLEMLTKLKLLNYLIEIEALTMDIQNNCKIRLRLQ